MSEQIEQARADGRSALTEPEGKALAAQFGLAVPQSVLVSPKEDLRAALQGMSPPFVVKVVSPDILHKSDAGGVKVGLTDHAAVSEAVQDMAAIPAILLRTSRVTWLKKWHPRDRRLSSAVSTIHNSGQWLWSVSVVSSSKP